MYQYQTHIDVDTNSTKEIKAFNELAAKHSIFPQLISPRRIRESVNDNGNPVFMLHSTEQVNIRNMIIGLFGDQGIDVYPLTPLEPRGACYD